MKEKTLKFIDELKSWRQENPEMRSFSIIVTDREDTVIVSAEGESTALASAALAQTVQFEDIPTLTTIIETGRKAEFVIDNMDDFVKFTQNKEDHD